MQPPGGPDSADLETLLARGERARVDLQESVPVYVAYFTTWVDEDATVTFHPDVYERDEPIQAVQERR